MSKSVGKFQTTMFKAPARAGVPSGEEIASYGDLMLVLTPHELIARAATFGCTIYVDRHRRYQDAVRILNGDALPDNIVRALVKRYREIQRAAIPPPRRRPTGYED